ncbi:hypothetical protein T07_10751 [Trichinella nelsoni]|uniref:Uncharacterized protein n=1 Tax=Trichinella nelsoni TaxID=6336 RepID=A0A0V0S9I4_9BILA|nr:hypothetical protein T07_10751 [Trichinella nelsoni]
MYEVLTAFVVASGLAFVEVESIGIEFTTVGNDTNNIKTFSHWTQSGTVASLKGEGSDWCSQLRALFVSRFTVIGQFRQWFRDDKRAPSTAHLLMVFLRNKKFKFIPFVQLLKLLCEKAENYRPRT